LIDPSAHQSDLLWRQSLTFLGHDLVRIESRDHFHHEALRTFSNHSHLATGSSLHKGAPRFQAEITLTLTARVTLHATGLEDRFDVARKIHGPGRSGRKLIRQFFRWGRVRH